MQWVFSLTLVDAVDTMEGDGPTGGSRRHIGLTADLFPTGGAQPPLNRIRQHWNLLRPQADQMRHHQVEGIKTIPHSGSGHSPAGARERLRWLRKVCRKLPCKNDCA